MEGERSQTREEAGWEKSPGCLRVWGWGGASLSWNLGEVRLAQAVSGCQAVEKGKQGHMRSTEKCVWGSHSKLSRLCLKAPCLAPTPSKVALVPSSRPHSSHLNLPTPFQKPGVLFFWTILALLPRSTLNCSPAAHSQFSSHWETFSSLAGEASGYQSSRAECSEGPGAGHRDVGIVRAMGWLWQQGQ